MPESLAALRQGVTFSASSDIEVVGVTRAGEPTPLVLKRMLPGAQAGLTVRFETAAQILPRLSTPHVPRLHACGLQEGEAYLLLDQVDGTTLEAILRRGALPLEELVALGTAVARALHAIHQQQTIHLNLLPSHVLITPGGTAVLLSFGLAHHRECPDLLPAADWVRAVTSPWMAPEQLFQVRSDPRSDQWALGALLYQLAVGHPPLLDPAAPEPGQQLQDRLWKLPAPLRHLRPDLPAWLQEIVHRCLEVAPSDRFDHCGQVAWLLTHPDAVELDPGRARTEPAPVWQRLSRWFHHQRDPVHALKGLRNPQHHHAPLILLALDPDVVEGDLPLQLREAAAQLMGGESQSHLACLMVVPRAEDSREPPGTSAACREGQQALRQWARPLGLPASRVSFHVFEGGDPLDHLLAFARDNQADQLIIGCSHRERGLDDRHRVWPPLMSRVVAEADCSVFVVRPRGDQRAALGVARESFSGPD